MVALSAPPELLLFLVASVGFRFPQAFLPTTSGSASASFCWCRFGCLNLDDVNHDRVWLSMRRGAFWQFQVFHMQGLSEIQRGNTQLNRIWDLIREAVDRERMDESVPGRRPP